MTPTKEYWDRYYAENCEKIKERSRQWRKDNPVKLKEQTRKWYVENADKTKRRSRDWSVNHPGRFKEIRSGVYRRWYNNNPDYHRKWRLKNKEKLEANRREWEKNNRGKLAYKASRRRAIKRQRSVAGESKLILRIYKRAEQLRRWFNVCVDHITPLSRGGSHIPSNLQIIYRWDNERKGSKLDYQPRVVFL